MLLIIFMLFHSYHLSCLSAAVNSLKTCPRYFFFNILHNRIIDVFLMRVQILIISQFLISLILQGCRL